MTLKTATTHQLRAEPRDGSVHLGSAELLVGLLAPAHAAETANGSAAAAAGVVVVVVVVLLLLLLVLLLVPVVAMVPVGPGGSEGLDQLVLDVLQNQRGEEGVLTVAVPLHHHGGGGGV